MAIQTYKRQELYAEYARGVQAAHTSEADFEDWLVCEEYYEDLSSIGDSGVAYLYEREEDI